jgi:putative selenium metabolism hydrolase
MLNSSTQQDLLEFTQSLVRTKSLSGQEEAAIRLAAEKMKSLDFDEVVIDAMGNLLGRIGSGPKAILFDSHLDVVDVNDAELWERPPFSGSIERGRLHGRGSADMKGGAAASIYAAALAKRRGLDPGKTVYVSCGVFEEDCDGESLKHTFAELDFKPDYAVICEPSNNEIVLGHKGKAQVIIKTRGVSAHGSAPEKGVNAVYEMAEIIQRVERTNLGLREGDGAKGSLVLSRISSTSASLNAVPSECEIYLDRRTVPGESDEDIRREMDRLIEGKRASWEPGTLYRTSWTGLGFSYEPFHPAWKIDLDHELTQACTAAYAENFGRAPAAYGFWDFSTNAVTPVRMGIPTIGFGPGEPKLAHMRDEYCEVQQIVEACSFYTRLIERI